MPFFFLCLLEDSSLESNLGAGVFFFLPLVAAAPASVPVCTCAALCTSLVCGGASDGFSTGGNGLLSVGPTVFNPPGFCAPGTPAAAAAAAAPSGVTAGPTGTPEVGGVELLELAGSSVGLVTVSRLWREAVAV